ncbi:MAG: hydantoinase B/oxoprolinase family protein [Actinobacteria bacterium]|nr:hydantoinase B/oxoprolinase family protein [Actinomycetota bacterium]
MSVDPVTVEVIRNALGSIARQMNNNLARSAYTPIIYEMKDCSVGVFDAKARLLGQSPGLPMFLGNLEMGIVATTEHFGGTEVYRPGDVYAVNDPFLVGSHLNDVVVFSPIFFGGALIGFGATKAHWLDIGAKDAGRPVDTTEIFQEGYRLGPTHLYRGGEPVEEMIDLLLRNSRLPRSVWGDLHAQITACRTGEQRLVALYERFGSTVMEEATASIFAQCEELDRAVVAAIPDGVYRAEGAMDSDGPGGHPVRVAVAVTVGGDEMTVDLTGSSGPTPHSVNSPLPGTVAGARLAFKCLVNPDVPVTAGTFRNLRVVAPEDTVFNARPPRATLHYYPPLGLMIDLVIQALAPALPTGVVAGQPADPMNVTITGYREDGSRYVTGDATAVGWGAHASGDGANGLINYGAGDLKNYPVEVIEARYPLRVHRYGLREGSGGAGHHRGGLGIVREYEFLGEETELTLWLERSTMPAWGLFGGAPGAPTAGEVEIDGTITPVTKVNALRMPRGGRVRIFTGGGGGYGPPNERPPELVAADIADGYVCEWPASPADEGRADGS